MTDELTPGDVVAQLLEAALDEARADELAWTRTEDTKLWRLAERYCYPDVVCDMALVLAWAAGGRDRDEVVERTRRMVNTISATGDRPTRERIEDE